MDRAESQLQTQTTTPDQGASFNWKERATKIAVPVLIALGVAGLAGCSTSGEAAPQPTAVSVEATGHTFNRLVNPADCVSPTNDPNFLPPTVVECRNFDKLSQKDQQIILQAEQSSPDQFKKLPVANQQAFQNFVIENNSEHALFLANNALNNLDLGAYTIKSFNPNYHPESQQQGEITENDQVATNFAVLNNLNTMDKTTGKLTYDKDTAVKILPAIAAVGSPAYITLLQGIESADTQPFQGSSNFVGISTAGTYVFMPFSNISEVKEKKLSNGLTVQEKTAETSQIIPANDADGWKVPYGDVKITYDQVKSSTLDGKGTTNVLIEDIVAKQ